jgi:hypothetical protein
LNVVLTGQPNSNTDESGAELRLKIKLLVFCLLVALILGIVAPLHVSGAASPAAVPLGIEIQRTITTGPFGVVHVTDTFTVTNDGTVSASSLDFGFLKKYRNDFYYVDAKDNLGRVLTIDANVNSTSEFYWLRVHFAQELGSNKTYKFTVTSVFDNLITPIGTGFEFNFTAAPVLTQDANIANVTLLAAQDSTFVTIPNSTYVSTRVAGFPALLNAYEPWKAYSKEFFYGPFRSVTQQVLTLISAGRDIIIGGDGSLTVKDSYALYNPSVAISSFVLTLPDGANNIVAYDTVGAMWASPQNPGSPYQVTITPRYGTFRGSENFNFTLTYNLPPSEYLKQTSWWGGYNLTMSLFNDNEDLLIQTVTVRIITPSGISLGNLKLPSQSSVTPPLNVSADYRTIKLQGITNLNNLTFGSTFNYIPFWSAVQVLPWIFVFEVVVFAAVIANKYRRGPELAVPVPVERLREFVSLYDERIALSRELVAMEEDVNRGSLVKHEFRRRSKVVELRLDEINKSLMEVKSELRSVSPRYDELIRRIDRAEAEAEASRASVDQVRSQYRAGKITREAYDTVMNDISKRIDRAESTVETILITLREEAR